MTSTSYSLWATIQAKALDEIEAAHAAVGGSGRGRRYATEQINHAYAVLLASQFQRFCRGLHSECYKHLIAALAPPPELRLILVEELKRGRQLDRGNAHPSSLGADFGRMGIDFWRQVEGFRGRNTARRAALEELNAWRNAIAHQDFDRLGLRGSMTLHLARVRRWRRACHQLAKSFDAVMGHHLLNLTGTSPW